MAYILAMKTGCKNVLKLGNKDLAGRIPLASFIFLEWHRDLSWRKVDGLSLSRSEGLNNKDFKDYFQLLLETYEKYDLHNPGTIDNVACARHKRNAQTSEMV